MSQKPKNCQNHAKIFNSIREPWTVHDGLQRNSFEAIVVKIHFENNFLFEIIKRNSLRFFML